jgi:hypothetical protein
VPGVFGFSLVLFGAVWLALGKAGLFSDVVEDPPEAVMALSFIGAALVSIRFGYLYATRRGWSEAAAGMVAIASVPFGFLSGVFVVYWLPLLAG